MKYALKFEPAFVEDAVFLAIRSLEASGEKTVTGLFHSEKNRIYEERKEEGAFQELHENFFLRLGLHSAFKDLLREFPFLDDPKLMVFIRRAYGRREEGSELYLEGDSKTVLLSLQTKRVLERFFLEAFVRHELLRVSDMLDPLFQYSPNAVLGGASEAEENLIRDRFRFLWDLYIDLRVGKEGFETIIEKKKTGPEMARLFEKVHDRNRWTQEELLKLARSEQWGRAIEQGGFRCVLCGFQSYQRADFGEVEADFIAQEIQRDRPDWKPSLGTCNQCFELYRSRIKVAL